MFRQARLLIIAIDAYQLNEGLPLSERFYHFAGLRDRWRLDPQPETIFGWFFRTEEKAKFYQAIAQDFEKKVLRIVPQSTESGPKSWVVTHYQFAYNPNGGDFISVPIFDQAVKEPVESWYNKFQFSKQREALLKKVITSANHDSQQVVLIQMPLREEFTAEVERTHQSDYHAYQNSVSGLLTNVLFVWFETSATCNLDVTDFNNWNHASPAGAEKFTVCFTQALMAARPELIQQLR